MKKICLIGSPNTIERNIFHMLSADYQVQICMDDPRLIEEIFHVVSPDLVLIYISDQNEVYCEIFELVKALDKRVQVLCIGAEEEISYFKEYLKEERIRILLRPVNNNQIREKIKRILGAHSSGQGQTGDGLAKKKRIQIIDDSSIQLRMLQGLLERQYIVNTAISSEEALKQMELDIPHLILLDYDMPGCDGIETFEMIKKDMRFCDIPVVFLTGVNDRKRIQAVLNLQPEGYLLKPVSKKKLLDMVQGILQADKM